MEEGYFVQIGQCEEVRDQVEADERAADVHAPRRRRTPNSGTESGGAVALGNYVGNSSKLAGPARSEPKWKRLCW